MRYRIAARIYHMEDGTAYTGYDILGQTEEGLPLRVEDVTDDRSYARLLCAALNRERVEPVHLYDVISDILADSEMKILADSEMKNTLLHG